MSENEHNISAERNANSSKGIRKLAAIMFTDIKDFSKKMQQDEAATMRMLEVHNGMMRETVQKYRGTVIKTLGDAFLVFFDSVIDATACAIEAQQNFLEYNKDRPAGEKIATRIGVHLGDVIVKDKDVFGDGVNIASRVQAMAEPGGVSITDSVYQQVKNKLDIYVVKLGAPQMKNIREAIKVYQVIIVPATKTRGKLATNLYVAGTLLKRKRSKQLAVLSLAVALALIWVWTTFLPEPKIKSLAVMPFENLGSPEQEYLTDGLSEEIISQLSRMPEVLVISKASSFSFKGTKLDDKEISEQLGVQFLLKGNVRAVAGQVNVVAYMMEPVTGLRLWTETYALTQNEIFQLQYEIPRQIAHRFKLQFLAKVQATSPEVYDLYSHGLYERSKLLREGNLAAMGYFTEALLRDSNFVPARVALAQAQVQNYDWGWDRSARWLTLAEENCLKVIRTDSTNADAWAILGKVKINMGQREKGIEILRKALNFDSRNHIALDKLGQEYLFNLNDAVTGISHLQRAFQTDPTNFIMASNIGIGYGMSKNYPAAIDAFRRASSLNPNHDYPWQKIAIAFEKSAQYDSASYYYRVAAEKNPLRSDTYLYWGELLLSLANYAKAESVLTAGIRQTGKRYRLVYDLGVAYSWQGKSALAEEAWQEGRRIAENLIDSEPRILEHLSYFGLFNARLGLRGKAIQNAQQAIEKDSTDNEVVFNAARVYAILGKKSEMLKLFKKARSMSSEYDANYLATAIDFENYKKDPDLLAIAQ